MSETLADIEKLIRDYQAWLSDKTKLRDVESAWVEITTPYLDRHNDSLQIFARRENGAYLLTDDGYILRDLEASGCSINTDKRRDLLDATLNGFGVKLRGDALEVHTSPDQFPRRKHNLIQSMLAVNDLFYLAQPFVRSLFFEDVESWLEGNNVRYTPKVKLPGVSGYDHLFHFVIPKSNRQPERVIQPITRPSKETVQAFIYQWSDVEGARKSDSRAYALLNDEEPVASSELEALQNYKIRPVLWSHRTDVIGELAA